MSCGLLELLERTKTKECSTASAGAVEKGEPVFYPLVDTDSAKGKTDRQHLGEAIRCSHSVKERDRM